MLIVHAGGRKVGLDEVRETPTPDHTMTHWPIPHGKLVDLVTERFLSSGYEITESEYAIRDGNLGDTKIPAAQFFGLFRLKRGQSHADYDLIAGLRNSHDKTIPAAICLGSHVFVCDNMAFSGEITLARKHTRFIFRDLPGVVANAVGGLENLRNTQETRISTYKNRFLKNQEAYSNIVEGLKVGVIPSSKVIKVVEEWDKKGARHPEFAPRNAWSLFNCFTEVLKDYPIDGAGHDSLQKRTERLHGLLDLVSGLVGNKAEPAKN